MIFFRIGRLAPAGEKKGVEVVSFPIFTTCSHKVSRNRNVPREFHGERDWLASSHMETHKVSLPATRTSNGTYVVRSGRLDNESLIPLDSNENSSLFDRPLAIIAKKLGVLDARIRLCRSRHLPARRPLVVKLLEERSFDGGRLKSGFNVK